MVERSEVGRKLVALGRQRKLRKQFIACCLWSFWAASDGRLDYRCLTARYRIKSREAGLKVWPGARSACALKEWTIPNTSMALLIGWVVKGNPVCCSFPDGNGNEMMSIGNENDQVS